MGPVTPRHQQGINISAGELLSIIISISAWGIPGEGIVHIVVTDNMNAMSWMNKKRPKRGISLHLLYTFMARGILFRLKIVIVYARTAVLRAMLSRATWPIGSKGGRRSKVSRGSKSRTSGRNSARLALLVICREI